MMHLSGSVLLRKISGLLVVADPSWFFAVRSENRDRLIQKHGVCSDEGIRHACNARIIVARLSVGLALLVFLGDC